MDKIQPEQLIGLAAAFILALTALLSVNFREEIGAVCQGLGEFLVSVFRRFVVVRWPDEDGSEPAEPGAVLAETNQEDDELVLAFEDIFEWLRSHKLTTEEAVDLFAVMRRENGDHFLSANKILDATGGTASEVKAQIAVLRPKPPAPKIQGRVGRPVNGW